jgi:hypothetical protein
LSDFTLTPIDSAIGPVTRRFRVLILKTTAIPAALLRIPVPREAQTCGAGAEVVTAPMRV